MGAVCASVLVSSTGTGGIEGSADNSRTTRGRSSQPAARHSAGSQLSRTQHSRASLCRRWSVPAELSTSGPGGVSGLYSAAFSTHLADVPASC